MPQQVTALRPYLIIATSKLLNTKVNAVIIRLLLSKQYPYSPFAHHRIKNE
jgi:hypothetical protein